MAIEFKDSIGRWKTTGMFLEGSTNGYNQDAPYTMKSSDHKYKGKEYKSIHKIYVELEDPTEYRIATEYFGGWQHWKKICESPIMQPHIETMREELNVKLRAKGIAIVKNDATDAESKTAVQSAKWLSNRGWAEETEKKRGRPSKEEVEGEKRKIAQQAKEFEDDFARIKAH